MFLKEEFYTSFVTLYKRGLVACETVACFGLTACMYFEQAATVMFGSFLRLMMDLTEKRHLPETNPTCIRVVQNSELN